MHMANVLSHEATEGSERGADFPNTAVDGFRALNPYRQSYGRHLSGRSECSNVEPDRCKADDAVNDGLPNRRDFEQALQIAALGESTNHVGEGLKDLYSLGND